MIENPFLNIELKLNRLESLILQIKDQAKPANNQQEVPDHCDSDGAREFLNSQGYKIKRGSLYKLTSAKAIPFKVAGSRLIFSRKALLTWLESQIVERSTSTDTTLTLASSARRKQKRG